jgi:hypothetical protein
MCDAAVSDLQNPYRSFIAIPYQGDNLFASLDEVPIHTTKKERNGCG